MWQKYVNIAVLKNNTSYQTSIGCEPGRAFHGRVPYNVLYITMGFRPRKTPAPNSQSAVDGLKPTEIIFQDIRENTMQSYIRYKAYYDKKTNPLKLKKNNNMCRF